MGAILTDPRVCQRWREAKHLVLLAAFEDSATGTRVKGFRQDLSRQLDPHCQVVEHVWLFNMFRLRELREIAAEEAAAADLIVISAHDTDTLPDEVKGWVDLWLQQKGDRQPVLLALLDPTRQDAPRAVEAYLREAARLGGLEFLVESLAAPESR